MDNNKILEKISLKEKIKWTSGNSVWSFLGSKKLNIEEIVVADGPHGLRAYTVNPGNESLTSDKMAPTTMFPIAAAMAATFNEGLLFEIGKAIGKECNMYNIDVLLAPGINMKRSPLAGRNFEYYSEDPYLTSRCAINYVNGVQSTGVGACIKHFALNEQENQRRFIDTICDERTMHEFYLRPFYNTIKEAKPYTIMSSYNKVNGHYASESSYLLKDVLRDKWGFDGVVISDWGAAQDKVKSIKNGLNIEMPGPSEFENEVFEALQNNELTEKQIDESLLPLLKLRDKTLKNKNKGQKADLDLHHTIAKKVSEEAIVLLKNDGILPLEKNIRIGVIGSFAKTPRVNGGGSANVLPYILENPLTELENVFTVDFGKGYEEEDTTKTLLDEVKEVCNNNEIIIYYTGTTEKLEVEGKEREHMCLPQGHIDVYNEIQKHNRKVIVVLNNGSAINVTPIMSANAIIESWMLGSANSKAVVDVITGDINPSGRLTETFPLCIEHTPHYGLFPSKEDTVNYSGDLLRNGYRYYDTHQYPVRYPFGYGLSYTSFEYKNLILDKTTIEDTEILTVKVTVKNSGNMAGKEVVQLYVSDVDSYYPRPTKELKGFDKVYLEPNEEKVVTFKLDSDAFSIYAVDFNEFRVESGEYKIMIGKNANAIVLEKVVVVNSKDSLRNNLTLSHPLKNFALYKEKQFAEIENTYRTFPWFEIEEPALRVLKRIKSEFGLSDEIFDSLLQSLLD